MNIKFFLTLFILSFFINQNLRSQTTINICYTPWFGAKTNSSPDKEIAEIFAQSIGRKAQFTLVEWADLFKLNEKNKLTLFDTKKCHLYSSNITQTPERTKILQIIPYYSSRNLVLIQSNDSKKITQPESLGSKRTAVVSGTTYEAWIKQANNTFLKNNKIKFDSLNDVNSVDLLTKGQIDFVILDSTLAILAKNQFNTLSIAFPVGETDLIGWGIPLENTDLKNKIESFFKNEKSRVDSKMNSLFKKHYGMNITELEKITFFILPH